MGKQRLQDLVQISPQTEEERMTFEGITLVTGAAGFMGSHLVERLAGRGGAVVS